MTERMRDLLERALREPSIRRSASVELLDEPVLTDAPEAVQDSVRAARASMMTEVNRHSLTKFNDGDVHVRRVRAANDVIDSYESRFTIRGLRELGKVAIGAPMARGHRMDGDVYARVFDSNVQLPAAGPSKVRELRDLAGASWMWERFYWPKDLPDAENIRARIDGGLWKEVSVHFRADELPCGICDKDVRECDHEPGRMYDGRKAFFEMQAVRKMLETSFVVRGAQLETAVTGDPGSRSASLAFETALMEVKTDASAREWWRKGLRQDGEKRSVGALFAVGSTRRASA